MIFGFYPKKKTKKKTISLSSKSMIKFCHVFILFRQKTFYKDSFPHFPVFGSTKKKKKIDQWKTIFTQRKILIKIKLIFYRLFSKNFFWQTISLSLVASPINIIFFYSHEKHRFLAFSLSHSKLSHFFSILFAFYLFIYYLIWIPSFFFFFFRNFLFDRF